VWKDIWQVQWRDVIILNTKNERSAPYNLTSHDLADPDNYDELRSMIIGVIAAGRTAANAWQNRTEPLDLNNDKFVSPRDALVAINDINRNGSRQLQGTATTNLLDANGDGFLSPRDALNVINHLNRISNTNAPAAAVADVTNHSTHSITGDPPADDERDLNPRSQHIDRLMAAYAAELGRNESTGESLQARSALKVAHVRAHEPL
jgi:hypothetical protein